MERDEAERRRGRRRLAGAGLCALAAALIAGLWSQRTPVAAHFVDQALARKGVRARYRITRFGTASQRLEDIVVGDPAHPDLVADWAELRMSLGLNGPELHALSAGGVRLRGRIVDGRLRLGDIDKLLPPPSTAPFSLPDIAVALANMRVALATPLGPIALLVDGRGRLVDGFSGHVAAEAASLRSGACAVSDARGRLTIAIRRRRPLLSGPLAASEFICDGTRAAAPRLALDAAASATLDRWTGTAGLTADSLKTAAAGSGRTRADIAFDLAHGRGAGTLALAARDVWTTTAGVEAAGFRGRYAVDLTTGTGTIDGDARLIHAAATSMVLRRAASDLDMEGAGTPAAPLLAALRPGVMRALADLDGVARLTLSRTSSGTHLDLASAALLSGSGARLSYVGSREGGGEMRLRGGGLPQADLSYRHEAHGLGGEARLAGFAASDARLAPLTLGFTIDRNGTRLQGRPVIDGPLGDGRVEGLTLPLDIWVARGGAMRIDPGCAVLGFARLTISDATFGDGRLPLCPLGAALLTRTADGRIGGGALVRDLHLLGRIGDAPLAIAAAEVRLPFDRPGFSALSMTLRLGSATDPTRLTIAKLDGGVSGHGLTGSLEGAEGRLVNVPLLLSDGAGAWRLAGGRLVVERGALTVADALTGSPRFKPLRAADVRLEVADGPILGAGALIEPGSGTRVAEVVLRHDLRSGAGDARLTTPGLAFTKAFQPDALTPLVTGLVADARGTLSGEATIDWTRRGVTSSGTFRTAAMDFAAPFGPVMGFATTLRFDDLLGLHTPPGQIATVQEINPGIAVTGGRVTYQLTGSDRIAVESARWPFFGGTLALAPTTLDFTAPAERRLTFRVDGLDAAKFVEETGFDNLAVTGTFDGEVPLVFTAEGGRIDGGKLVVRPGGGTLAYVGEISRARLGRFGKLAFDALKSMRYTGLSIALDGSLDGEVVSKVLLDGISETPKDAAESLLLRRLAHLPFRFRVAIRAPFRGLVNSAASLNDPRGLIQRSLAANAATVVQP